MQLGNWQLDTVNGGAFRMDGGVMFGVVPKALWKNVVTADDENRIACANHCVLARDGNHTVLVDTGYGDKFDKLDQKFYSAELGEPLLASLSRLGVSPEQVDTLVLSHLHFDHVGGATRFDQQRRLIPTFPNARHIVGRWEWEDATACPPELETAYSLDGILPLAPLVALVDDGQEIVPGLKALLTGGHTRGHLSFVFTTAGQTAI
jgi:glyoxylase-like metal-dependent hydrolase (beta-lactamase superfamily II)